MTNALPLQSDVLYDTATGSKKQLVLAVSNSTLGFNPSVNAVLTLNLVAEQQAPKEFRQYVYRRTGSFSVINGVEDGLAKKVLRYTATGVNPDLVEVYVDGVKREQGAGPNDYRLYDGSVGSPVPPNSVLFNSVVTGVAPQVDVIVTKAATISTTTLVFNRAIDDESRVGTGAWEGVDLVSHPILGDHSLFFCDFSEISSGLAVDVKLRLNPAVPSTIVDGGPPVVIQPQRVAVLLSRARLFTQLDRQRSRWVPLSQLEGANDYLLVKLIDGVRSMFVTETSALNIFPILQVVRFNAPTLQKTSLIGDDDAAELENTIIVGPDA